ncbi:MULTISPECIES: FeoA family protein [unclassified Campylobacter]|uniref:FeoA family protein n=1 Tax=Campylobacter TaxID=194 RepID=UPI00147459B6|nr:MULTISPECIES: FeoA family protein [unclassified Campylobacter]QKF91650.1 ferrous iron transport protein A [Campylobacter sp. CCUG 57310]
MNLSLISSGKKCKITKLNATGKLLQKLLDMGFVIGATIEVIREAPLYDPVELKIHNYLISLRKSEAELIEVEELLKESA